MTSCAVSPLDEGLLVLLLTHRRGGAVLALKKAGADADSCPPASPALAAFLAAAGYVIPTCWLSTLTWLWSLRAEAEAISGDFGLFQSGGASLALSRTTTAEHLAAMYSQALAAHGYTDGDVCALAVGAGPGSFTGLRIGCAFANGLAAGRPRTLWALACTPLQQEREWLGAEEAIFWESGFEVLTKGVDESFAHVNLLDVVLALSALATGDATRVDTLEPAYGREPGPVLKLREAQGT